MTLIDLVCPDCGAKLRINDKLTHATCNYCGHNIVIKNDQQDGHQFGFDFERGRMQAQSVTNTELVTRIQKLLPVLPKVQKYQERLNSLTFQSQELETLCQQDKNKSSIIVIILPCILGLVVAGILFLLKWSISSYWHYILISAAFGMILGLLTLLPRYFHAQKYKRLISKQAQLQKTKDSVLAGIPADDIELIPSNYWDITSLKYIYSAITKKRAMSIYQAINLYEDELAKREQLALQREELDMQRENLELERKKMIQDQRRMEQEQENMKEMGKSVIKGAAILGASAIVKGIINKK